MRITRLVAEKFRGFEKLELDFPLRCTVLVGTNGSGKTTVLDALVRLAFSAASEEHHEDRQRLAGDAAFSDRTLEADRFAIQQIWQDVSVTSVDKRRELEVTKQGKRFLFPQLSSGEHRVLTLVGEVARLLAEDRPQDPDAWQRPVVLLADEVEQHLHPVWQQEDPAGAPRRLSGPADYRDDGTRRRSCLPSRPSL